MFRLNRLLFTGSVSPLYKRVLSQYLIDGVSVVSLLANPSPLKNIRVPLHVGYGKFPPTLTVEDPNELFFASQTAQALLYFVSAEHIEDSPDYVIEHLKRLVEACSKKESAKLVTILELPETSRDYQKMDDDFRALSSSTASPSVLLRISQPLLHRDTIGSKIASEDIAPFMNEFSTRAEYSTAYIESNDFLVVRKGGRELRSLENDQRCRPLTVDHVIPFLRECVQSSAHDGQVFTLDRILTNDELSGLGDTQTFFEKIRRVLHKTIDKIHL